MKAFISLLLRGKRATPQLPQPKEPATSARSNLGFNIEVAFV